MNTHSASLLVCRYFPILPSLREAPLFLRHHPSALLPHPSRVRDRSFTLRCGSDDCATCWHTTIMGRSKRACHQCMAQADVHVLMLAHQWESSRYPKRFAADQHLDLLDGTDRRVRGTRAEEGVAWSEHMPLLVDVAILPRPRQGRHVTRDTRARRGAFGPVIAGVSPIRGCQHCISSLKPGSPSIARPRIVRFVWVRFRRRVVSHTDMPTRVGMLLLPTSATLHGGTSYTCRT